MKKEFLSANDISDIIGMSYAKALAFIKYSGIKYIKINRSYYVRKDTFAEFTKNIKEVEFEL